MTNGNRGGTLLWCRVTAETFALEPSPVSAARPGGWSTAKFWWYADGDAGTGTGLAEPFEFSLSWNLSLRTAPVLPAAMPAEAIQL